MDGVSNDSNVDDESSMQFEGIMRLCGSESVVMDTMVIEKYLGEDARVFLHEAREGKTK